ncbi:hypothetical protein HPP92_024157 [Vanilla planifolia]|uniref:Major facilitator superfamily (MFS) profile domain-containing protein n=1 Tax=Vanilla planifolia TaxID=51239 RepID=A0A835UB27_VANPL|nr:hypothetical protein HPP92_024157 [Vanilla planifolia]
MKDPKATPESNSGKQAASEDHKSRPRNKYALACALLASMTSVLLGYDVAVMSGASIFIKEDLHVSDTKLEIVTGIINLYSLIGSIAAGRTSDWIGRRYTMVLAAAIFFFGAIMMGLATNYAFLMAGRFVAGVGVGFALMIAPVYTAEVAPTSARGFLTSFPEVFINSGILLGYISNFAFAGLPNHLNWRVMFLVGAVPPVFLAAGVILLMPESPRWLVMQGRHADAAAVLSKTSDSSEEAVLRLEQIKSAAGITSDSHGMDVWRDLVLHPTPMVRRVLVAAVGLQFFQQASGIDSVVLYSPRIFEKVGITSKSQKLGATVAVGFAKTIFILVATFLLDRLGRRPLLLSSAGGWYSPPCSGFLPFGDRPANRRREGADGSGGGEHRDGTVLRGVVLHRIGADSVGLQLGDLSFEASCARGELGDGNEQGDERGYCDDIHFIVQSDHHLRQLLSVCGNRFGKLGVLLLLLAGDEGEEPGGDAAAV